MSLYDEPRNALDDVSEVYDDLPYSEEEYRPRWTVKRLIYLLIALVIIVTLLVYMVLPALQFWLTPPPSPLAPPLNL
jgi:lipopolysaccharide/colanic/teichoic acid biosynthesis glycosyltransferase